MYQFYMENMDLLELHCKHVDVFIEEPVFFFLFGIFLDWKAKVVLFMLAHLFYTFTESIA